MTRITSSVSFASSYQEMRLMQMLDFHEIHRNEWIKLSDRDDHHIRDFIAWKAKPHFPRRGRMAWHRLEAPLSEGSSSARKLSGVKIKGIGAYNPPTEGVGRDAILSGFSNEPIQPTTLPLSSFATYPHLGFDNEGKFKVTFGDTAPVGGILTERAAREYLTALRLCECNVPSIMPYLVVQYDSTDKFAGQPLGAVVSLTPDAAPYRISEAQTGAALTFGSNGERDEYYVRLLNALEVYGDPSAETTRLKAISALAFKVGDSLRRFSEAGLYRYSAEFPNFDFDFERSEVVFTDLDSTLFLDELPVGTRSRQILRDAASMVYHLVAKFSGPTALGAYTIRTLLDFNPVAAALRGYFPTLSEGEADRVSRALWRLYLPHFYLLNMYKNKIVTEWNQERRRSYKMDHHLFFLAVMYCFALIAERFNLSEKISFANQKSDDLLADMQEFLGNRFQYLEYALSEVL